MILRAACSGISSFGLCDYNPASPAVAYFTVGDAIAALALTLVIPQFLRPLFSLRLRLRRIRILYIYALCFLGVVFSVIAATLPNIPISRSSLFAYPVFWELFGGAAFVVSYAILAYGSMVPYRLVKGCFPLFAKEVAAFIGERDPKDYVEVSGDVLRNLPGLIASAGFAERSWRASAFFHFRNRVQLEDGGYASSVLRVMSDYPFCRALVEGSPWQLARTLRKISADGSNSQSAAMLVQQLARASLLSDRSLMAREAGWHGFSHAPVLTDALFGDLHVLKSFRPFSSLSYEQDELADVGFLQRLGVASTRALKATLDGQEYHDTYHIYDLAQIYENVFREIARRTRSGDTAWKRVFEATHAVEQMVEAAHQHIRASPDRDQFYIEDPSKKPAYYQEQDIVARLAEMVTDCVLAISNDFDGPGDPFWSFALHIWWEFFSDIGDQPDGMDPLQQRVALLLLAKLEDNLKGYFPAVSRVLVTMTGPYRPTRRKNPRSADALMERAIFSRLRNMRSKLGERRDRVDDFFPSHVSFDLTENELKFSSHGNVETTALSKIRPRMPDFSANAVRMPD